MIVFWIIVILLIAAALLFIIPPLWQRADTETDQVKRDELSIEVFKDQVTELERDLSNGTLSQEQFELAKQDIERELLESTKAGQEMSLSSNDVASAMAGKASAWVIIIALPIVTIAFYNSFGGGPDALNPEAVQQQAQVGGNGHEGADVEQMIASLTQRLEENPDDVEGWSMLGRSYYYLKNYALAAQAYSNAIERSPTESADLYADYADAQALANNRSLQGKPMQAVERAVQINPGHTKSLWLAGTGAYQVQDWSQAKHYWELLLQQLEPGSENARMIEANLGEVYQLMGETAPQRTSAANANSAASISGTVELDPALASQVTSDDVVFIFARAASGPRMPLAILRKQVKDLPMSFTLDDSMAMTPAMKMSNFDELVIGARVSQSGTAMAEPGDLEGLSGVVKLTDGNDVNLMISDVVQ